jgi:hypothetical protein
VRGIRFIDSLRVVVAPGPSTALLAAAELVPLGWARRRGA